MINDTLGKNIRKHRLNLNWTQEKLADTLCVSHQVISKWENGIATPDVGTLCALASIFNLSLDALCGLATEQADTIIKEIENEIKNHNTRYEHLYAKWKEIEKQLTYYPINDDLLYAVLKLLRTAHDRIETDQQKDSVNADILKISEKLLDFSRNDTYRSYANYNLAVYYNEQVYVKRNNEQDIENAKKSKMYAELVLYKDMPQTFYHSFGTVTIQEQCIAMEKTLKEMVRASQGACKTLIHFSKHFPNDTNWHSETYADVTALLNEIQTKLSTC